MLIINADDWGRSLLETDRAYRCFQEGTVTSVSAMVFMDDSERAADLARTAGMDVGLHVNLTESWTKGRPSNLQAKFERVRRFLKRSKYSQIFYQPMLRADFRAIFTAQLTEFRRLYGCEPSHVDGHQHMHLCTNMVFDKIVPLGQKVRRHFSFGPGEKNLLNRIYRATGDWSLSRSYKLTDYFFALSQSLNEATLARITQLATTSNVELMTHPINEAEFACLTSDSFRKLMGTIPKGTYAMLEC